MKHLGLNHVATTYMHGLWNTDPEAAAAVSAVAIFPITCFVFVCCVAVLNVFVCLFVCLFVLDEFTLICFEMPSWTIFCLYLVIPMCIAL